LHSDGLDGVFSDNSLAEELLNIIGSFNDPAVDLWNIRDI
jgi:hypothetical protein